MSSLASVKVSTGRACRLIRCGILRDGCASICSFSCLEPVPCFLVIGQEAQRQQTDFVMLVCAGLAVMNWIVTIAILVAMVNAYVYRIRSEEAMLQSEFGEQFTAYKARTWRLIPLVY